MQWATHHAEGYFIEDDRLWKLGGATPTQAVSCRECVMRDEATQLAQTEHVKIHLHQDLIKIQLLDQIHSLLLDASICKVMMECGCCKNFGPMHVHALLTLMTWRHPFEALASNYLTMPTGKGSFRKISLYIDVFA